MTTQKNDLEERLLEYSVRIIKLVAQLPNIGIGNNIARQLLRVGTSPYPNHNKVLTAGSPNEFVQQLGILIKNLKESKRCLRLILKVPLINKPELINDMLAETEELIKFFITSIRTAEYTNRLMRNGHSTSNYRWIEKRGKHFTFKVES
jgi:four helix bundle protein